MNKYRAFFDGMASVFFLDGLFGGERFVPKNSHLLRDRYKKIFSNTFEERVIADIRSDFAMFNHDMRNAINRLADDETNTK